MWALNHISGEKISPRGSTSNQCFVFVIFTAVIVSHWEALQQTVVSVSVCVSATQQYEKGNLSHWCWSAPAVRQVNSCCFITGVFWRSFLTSWQSEMGQFENNVFVLTEMKRHLAWEREWECERDCEWDCESESVSESASASMRERVSARDARAWECASVCERVSECESVHVCVRERESTSVCEREFRTTSP